MLLAAFACTLLVACSSGQQPEPSAEHGSDGPNSTTVDGVIRMAAIGDSITVGDSPDIIGGEPGPGSWVSHAIGPEIEYVGGWAQNGASIAGMVQAVTAPFPADVVVVLAGTNDLGGTPDDQVVSGLITLVSQAGVDSVVLSSVPPMDLAPENADRMNSLLEQTAAEQGWVWVDSAAGLRDGNVFAHGMTYDGIHPTEAGATVIGEAIRLAILEVFAIE